MGVMDGFWKWLGVQNEVEEEIIEIPAPPERNSTEKNSGSNIVSIHNNKSMKVVVCEPQKFEEVQALSDHLKNRRQVIINFDSTPPDIAQRMIDFITGTVYTLDGQSQQVGNNIFLFAPSNVEITKDPRSLMKKHGMTDLIQYAGSER